MPDNNETPKLESKILSITLMSPLQIKNNLIVEAGNGWELIALGSNYAFLQREVSALPGDFAYYVESITLTLPHQIKEILQAHGDEGWSLGGIGSSFMFMKRARKRDHIPRDFDMESITVRGIRGIEEIVQSRAAKGWGLCALGRNFAFFERLQDKDETQIDPRESASKAISITLKSPQQMARVLDEEGKDGWRLSAVGSSFMILTRQATD